MIEKRFTWLKKDVYAPQIVITDSLTEKDLTPTDCYELLNELAEENEQLKQDGFYWAKTAEARRKEIDKLRKDNSILKQQRDYKTNELMIAYAKHYSDEKKKR